MRYSMHLVFSHIPFTSLHTTYDTWSASNRFGTSIISLTCFLHWKCHLWYFDLVPSFQCHLHCSYSNDNFVFLVYNSELTLVAFLEEAWGHQIQSKATIWDQWRDQLLHPEGIKQNHIASATTDSIFHWQMTIVQGIFCRSYSLFFINT
jgi:hypothetical protein